MNIHNARILMITPFAKVQRGNSLTAARLSAGLNATGWQVDLLSLENRNWQEQLRSALDANQYALAHGFHALHFGRVINSQPALQALPLILTATGTDLNYDLWSDHRPVVLAAMSQVQKIVLFNDDYRHNLTSALPQFKDKMLTIPQGVWLEPGMAKSRQEFGIAADEFVFLLASGLRPVKNIELAIDGLSVLHQLHPRIRLLIIGPVIEKEYGQAIINRVSNLPWITYLGEIPHSQMTGILNLGDAVLNTSRSEGQPQAVLEAMSLGKPCILTAVPGNLNLIQTGREGFYITNADDLRYAGQALLKSPALREEMGQNARKLIEARFTLAQELNAYNRLYQEMLENYVFHS